MNYCERNARALLKTVRTFKDYEHIALRTVKDSEHNDRRTVMNYVSTSLRLHSYTAQCSLLSARVIIYWILNVNSIYTIKYRKNCKIII